MRNKFILWDNIRQMETRQRNKDNKRLEIGVKQAKQFTLSEDVRELNGVKFRFLFQNIKDISGRTFNK